MTTKYHYHYLLFSSRQSPPPERMATMLHELRIPVDAIRGYSQILNNCIQKSDSVSPQIRDSLQDILNSTFSLNDIIIAETPNVRHFTDDKLQRFRVRILPLILHIEELIEHLETLKPEIELICTDIHDWHDILRTNSNHIWATVDVLTNPALTLPPDISYWLNNRQSFWQEVHQGDSRSLAPILNGLTHSETAIRRDAIMLLRQLKHPSSFRSLITALTDENPTIRVEAIDALRYFSDKRAIEPIKNCLNDDKELVKSRAKEALAYLEQL